MDAAISSIADADAAAGNKLRSIFRNTPRGNEPLSDILRRYVLDLEARPWGTIGLTFNGTSGFSVPDIEKHDKLSAFAQDVLEFFLKSHAGIGKRAMMALKFVRRVIHQDEKLVSAARNLKSGDDLEGMASLQRRGARFAQDLIVPSRKRLPVSDWKDRSRRRALVNFAKSWTFWRLFIPMVAVTLLLGTAVFSAFSATTLTGLYGAFLLAVTGGLLASVLLSGIIIAGVLGLLRYHENKDIPDDRNPKLADIRNIGRFENRPGYAQNHFMSVSNLKGGWFRKLTLAVSLGASSTRYPFIPPRLRPQHGHHPLCQMVSLARPGTS